MRTFQGVLVATCLASAALLSLPVTAGEVQTKSQSLIQFNNPAGIPRWSYSLSAVTPASLKLVAVSHIVPTDTTGDLKAQLASALAKLDTVLAAHNADRSSIVVLDTHVVGTQLRQAQAASDALKAYFDGHLNGTTPFSAHDYPVRTTTGEAAIDGTNTQVAFDVKFVDTKANAGVQAGGERVVNFGGISAQQPDFTITGYGDPAAEARATIAKLKKVLAQSGMTLANVTSLNVTVSDPAVAAYNAGQMIVASNGAAPAAQKTAPVSAVEAAVKQGIAAALKADGVNPDVVHYNVAAAACASAAFKVDASGTARG
jgi:enamine deaminase RidA (YjgF/YER057c/UK114 family)